MLNFRFILNTEFNNDLFNPSYYELKDGTTNKYVLKEGVTFVCVNYNIDSDESLEFVASDVEFVFLDDNKFTVNVKTCECIKEDYKLGEITMSIEVEFDNVNIVLPN